MIVTVKTNFDLDESVIKRFADKIRIALLAYEKRKDVCDKIISANKSREF